MADAFADQTNAIALRGNTMNQGIADRGFAMDVGMWNRSPFPSALAPQRSEFVRHVPRYPGDEGSAQEQAYAGMQRGANAKEAGTASTQFASQQALAQGRYADVDGWYDTPDQQRKDILVGTGYGIPTAQDQKLAIARMMGARRG